MPDAAGYTFSLCLVIAVGAFVVSLLPTYHDFIKQVVLPVTSGGIIFIPPLAYFVGRRIPRLVAREVREILKNEYASLGRTEAYREKLRKRFEKDIKKVRAHARRVHDHCQASDVATGNVCTEIDGFINEIASQEEVLPPRFLEDLYTYLRNMEKRRDEIEETAQSFGLSVFEYGIEEFVSNMQRALDAHVKYLDHKIRSDRKTITELELFLEGVL